MSIEKQYVTCPNCQFEIELDKVLTLKIEGQIKSKYIEQLKKERKNFQAQLEKEYLEKEEQLKEKIEKAKSSMAQQLREEIKSEAGLEISSLKNQLADSRRREEGLKKKELDFLQRIEAVEIKERDIELSIAQRLAEERKKIFNDAYDKSQEETRLKISEKDKIISDLLNKVEEAQRQARQGSQQTQGEIMELELENMLAKQFPQDTITPVEKGASGADIFQGVYTKNGRFCGSILWESKRTKVWQQKWIQKLKDDRRARKADVAAIVSEIMPKDVEGFRLFEDIWIVEFRYAVFLATTLRAQVIHLATYKEALQGKGEKNEAIYSYITGQGYRDRMTAQVESYIAMQIKLIKERASMEKAFSERENDLKKGLGNLAGMHGDLASIIGPALPQVKNLELSHSEEEKNDSEIPF